MQTRINYEDVMPAAMALVKAKDYPGKSELEQSLLDLVVMRASQINHCAYCIDMHFKDAIASGEDAQRLYGLDAWREMPIYTDRERAALAWTEAITLLGEHGVSDELFEEVSEYFGTQEIVSLTMAICLINSFNRLNVSLKPAVPGTYESRRKLETAVNN